MKTTFISALLLVSNLCTAQVQPSSPIWANYDIEFIQKPFTPLAAGTIISVTSFLNASGSSDADDGIADSIPLGFPIIYNGRSYQAYPYNGLNYQAFVNVSVNGFVTVGTQPISAITSNPDNLFLGFPPNNTIAPYFGDHYYRTLEEAYVPSRISYETYVSHDTNHNVDIIDPRISTFVIEWRNLNVNDKQNPKSFATFQLRIFDNPKKNDATTPDPRQIIEFDYAPLDTAAQIQPNGAAVGAEDSLGLSHLNALFETSTFNGDSTRLSTTTTACWPPTNCNLGYAIRLVPKPLTASVSQGTTSINNVSIFPNPILASSTLSVSTLARSYLTLSIFDLLGHEVSRLFDGEVDPGQHSFTWNASSLSAGIYECVIQTDETIQRQKIALLK